MCLKPKLMSCGVTCWMFFTVFYSIVHAGLVSEILDFVFEMYLNLFGPLKGPHVFCVLNFRIDGGSKKRCFGTAHHPFTDCKSFWGSQCYWQAQSLCISHGQTSWDDKLRFGKTAVHLENKRDCSPKNENCHLLTLLLFQICMNFFLQLNAKDILKNVGPFTSILWRENTMEVDGVNQLFGYPYSKYLLFSWR